MGEGKAKAEGFVVRIMSWEGMKLLNICDAELLGQVIRGEGLEIRINRDYFGGELVEIEKALELINSSSIINLVGNRIVKKVLEERLACPDAVKRVGGTSFLMIYKFD